MTSESSFPPTTPSTSAPIPLPSIPLPSPAASAPTLVPVLVVDDDLNLLAAMKRELRGRYDLSFAPGGEEALSLLQAGLRPAVILCDMRMKGLDGIETLKRARDLSPDSVRLMLTGNADLQTAIDAINEGAIFRFLTKPCPPEVLESGLQASIRQYRLVTAERDLLEKTLAGSVKILADMVAMTLPESIARTGRVRVWIHKLIQEFKLPYRWQLELSALVAPLGMMSIPDDVLRRYYGKGQLSAMEWAMIERSPEAARNVISNIPRLESVAQAVYLQNKGFDGSGFPPDGPCGNDLPLDARILKICNDLSALCIGLEPTADEFAALSVKGHQYDPVLFKKIRACLEVAYSDSANARQYVLVNSLRAGQVVAVDVQTSTGRMVFSAMTRLTESHLEKLRNMARLKQIPEAVAVLVNAK